MRKYHQKMSENSYKVDKQIQRVHDEVPTAQVMLLDNQLSVVNNKAANHEQSQIQMRLIDEGRAQKQIGKGGKYHYIQHAHQSATEIQPTSLFSQECRDAKGDENDRRSCNRVTVMSRITQSHLKDIWSSKRN